MDGAEIVEFLNNKAIIIEKGFVELYQNFILSELCINWRAIRQSGIQKALTCDFCL